MMPILALKLLEAVEFLSHVINALTDKCVVGIKPNEARCRDLVELSLAMVTALVPAIGYDAAAKLAPDALASAKTIRQLAVELNVVEEASLNCYSTRGA